MGEMSTGSPGALLEWGLISKSTLALYGIHVATWVARSIFLPSLLQDFAQSPLQWMQIWNPNSLSPEVEK